MCLYVIFRVIDGLIVDGFIRLIGIGGWRGVCLGCLFRAGCLIADASSFALGCLIIAIVAGFSSVKFKQMIFAVLSISARTRPHANASISNFPTLSATPN